jgi:hypothetical protein
MLRIVTGSEQEMQMPVTAKLSQRFYERFGDDLTNELVEWMNQVDAGYRTEFRELFELNFAKFDAKLQHGLDEFRAKLHDEVGEVRQSLTDMKGELRSEIAASRTEAMKWNIVMWVGAVGTMVALVRL